MAQTASEIIETISDAFRSDFASRDHPSPYLGRFIDALDACDGSLAVPDDTASPNPQLVATALPALAESMPDTIVATTLAPLLERVDWYQIFDGSTIDTDFAAGLVAGQIIGKRGIVRSSSVFVGLFLLAPGLCYPLHQHPALEVYYVLGGKISIRHGRQKAPMNFAAGDISVTPPHQVHELRTGDEPCLLAYIWTGDMTGENWWWEEQPDHAWDRVCWERQADSSWAIARREPLTAAEAERAGDDQ